MSADQALLSLLVVNIDYKLQRRDKFSRGKQAGAVFDPVLRIFGSSDTGQRVCAHIHGVLPYVYFRPENLYHASFESEAKVRNLLCGLEEALEELLRNYKNNTYKAAAPSNRTSPYHMRRRIHSLEILRRKTIYGMYMDYFWFIKVKLYDPNDIKRVATILEEGALRGISMQSYESHIPYVLQFTSDFNIQPMGWMHVQTAKFRPPLPMDPIHKQRNVEAQGENADESETITEIGKPAVMESPTFSHIKCRRNNSLSSAPVREDSVHSADGNAKLFSSQWEPHVQLTQHQTETFLTPSSSGPNEHIVGLTHPSPGAPLSEHSTGSNSNSNMLNQPEFSNNSVGDTSNSAPAGTIMRSRLLTQSSIPAHLIWGNDGSGSTGEQHVASKVEVPAEAGSLHGQAGLSAEEQAEVERLLLGITASDLLWSQSEQPAPAGGHGAIAAPVVETPRRDQDRDQDQFNVIHVTEGPAVKEKESSCELELDIQSTDIMNKTMKRTAFGAEIWEEERLRCKLKGIEMDAAPEPPSTQTMHREPQPTELEFRQRLANLQAKGRALRGASKQWQRRSSHASAHNPVLSQFLPIINGESPAPQVSSAAPQHSSTSLRSATNLTPEVLSQWADERLLDAQRQAQLEDSVQDMFTAESTSIAEEYLKSQYSAPVQQMPDTAADGEAAAAATAGDDAAEDEELQESQEEMDNIMMSTQINAENMHDKAFSASLRSNTAVNSAVNQRESDWNVQQESSGDFALPFNNVDRVSPRLKTPPPRLQVFDPIFSEEFYRKFQQDTRSAGGEQATLVTTPSTVGVLFRAGSVGSGSSSRPPLHPSRSVQGQSTGLAVSHSASTAAISASATKQSPEAASPDQRSDLFQRWSPQDSPAAPGSGSRSNGARSTAESDSPVYTQYQGSPVVNSSDEVRSLGKSGAPLSISASYHGDSPMLQASPEVVLTASSVASSSISSGSGLSGSTGIGSAAKSISSVFRKRKHNPSGSGGPSVSFALFPEVIPGPVSEAPSVRSSATAITSAGGADMDLKHGLLGSTVISSALKRPIELIASLPATASKSVQAESSSESKAKRARRSVSFREAEEVCAPPKYTDTAGENSPKHVDHTNNAGRKPHREVSEVPNNVSPVKLVSTETTNGVDFADPTWRTRVLELRPSFAAPTLRQLGDLATYGLPPVVNVPPHFSNPADAPVDKVSHGNYLANLHRLKAKSDVGAFDGGFPLSQEEHNNRRTRLEQRVRCLIPTFLPPNPAMLRKFVGTDSSALGGKECAQKGQKSQIGTPTQTPYTCADAAQQAERNKSNAVGSAAASTKRMSRLTTMSTEVFCCTRQDFLTNPKYDAVQAVFWAIDDQIGDAESESVRHLSGVIYVLQKPLPGETYHKQASTADVTVPHLPLASSVAVAGSSAAVPPVTITATELQEPLRQLRELHKLQQMRILTASGLPADCFIEIVDSELELFQLYVHRVRTMDPDFMVGYEVETKSVGYLIRRGIVLQINMLQQLSRMPKERPSYRNGALANVREINQADEEETAIVPESEDKEDKSELDGDIVITGRLVLNCWRLMREELKLFNYTYSNVSANLLTVRVPYFTPAQLTRWFLSATTRHRTMRHMHQLTALNLQLLDKVDHVRRTAEFARLYGIDYNSVMTRGSQYRVEASLMLKAHALDYLLLSPTRKQVAMQAPMQVIPLVMEPRSQFYEDPVVVLDFQSLYPSMMLAYNLCFSTIMGKMRPGGSCSGAGAGDVGPDTTERLGTINYAETTSAANSIAHMSTSDVSESSAPMSTNAPYIAPNGSVFCHKNVRLGILPQIVQEMLTTRVMVKRAMKRHKPVHAGVGARDVLGKVMDARQLAIKLLSNVTYGYASAGYSGRMPMAELADAIVQSGRSTLEWTIQTIHAHPEWGGRVVYGDTDSVFVHLRGRTREEAFRIGQEISDFITAKSPADVVLKFEKVYFPSVLVTKKRYVGYMYETLAQKKPHFEAKGIEVVRRDQCPATVKMQEKVLRMLFETKDMSAVRNYLAAEWNKMMQGGDKLLLKDFIFSKEVRFGRYATVSSQPPGAVVACKAVLRDEMAVPPYNWRVPYVVVNGTPNAPLKNLVYAPEDVLRRGSELRLNYIYYMTKCINPALDRVLSLCGGDVYQWFKTVSRPKLRLRHINYDNYVDRSDGGAAGLTAGGGSGGANANTNKGKGKNKQTSMDQFTMQGSCEICSEDALPQKTLCGKCSADQQMSLRVIMSRQRLVAEKEQVLAKVCQNCTRSAQPNVLYVKNEIIGPDCCESLDCQIFFERCRLVTRLEDFQASVAEIEDIV